MDVRNRKAWMFASQHGNCYFFQFCILLEAQENKTPTGESYIMA